MVRGTEENSNLVDESKENYRFVADEIRKSIVETLDPTKCNDAMFPAGSASGSEPNIRINLRYSRPGVKYDEKTNLRHAIRGIYAAVGVGWFDSKEGGRKEMEER